MKIIFISFLVLLGFWFLGVVMAAYHVYSFRFPNDKTAPSFISYLIFSAILLLFLFNWVAAAYFGA